LAAAAGVERRHGGRARQRAVRRLRGRARPSRARCIRIRGKNPTECPGHACERRAGRRRLIRGGEGYRDSEAKPQTTPGQREEPAADRQPYERPVIEKFPPMPDVTFGTIVPATVTVISP